LRARLSTKGFQNERAAQASEGGQYIFFMSCPHAQRGLRTLVAYDESLTTSISQQHLEFTQRYLSFFFMAMISSRDSGAIELRDAFTLEGAQHRDNKCFAIGAIGIPCSKPR